MKILKKIFGHLFSDKNNERYEKFHRQKRKFLKKYPNYTTGDGTYGIPNVYDWNEGSTLKIGSYCSISGNVNIYLGGNHRTDWVSTYPFPAYIPEASDITGYGKTRGDVSIGSDVWIAANVNILSGVNIGHGAVIANGSIVTKDIEPYSIVAGNPAKIIGYRFEEDIRELLLATKWWEWPLEEVFSVTNLICSDSIEKFLEYAEKRNKKG